MHMTQRQEHTGILPELLDLSRSGAMIDVGILPPHTHFHAGGAGVYAKGKGHVFLKLDTSGNWQKIFAAECDAWWVGKYFLQYVLNEIYFKTLDVGVSLRINQEEAMRLQTYHDTYGTHFFFDREHHLFLDIDSLVTLPVHQHFGVRIGRDKLSVSHVGVFLQSDDVIYRLHLSEKAKVPVCVLTTPLVEWEAGKEGVYFAEGSIHEERTLRLCVVK